MYSLFSRVCGDARKRGSWKLICFTFLNPLNSFLLIRILGTYTNLMLRSQV